MTGARVLKYAERAGFNQYYMPLVQVELGGYEFDVFGSMSWTVSTVRGLPWETIHPAYVAITGDEREDVDQDAAADVVAGELQKHWAEYHNRHDLLLAIDYQQQKRIERALEPPQPKPVARTRAPRERKEGSTTDGKIPQKGASGYAVRVIEGGETKRSEVERIVSEEFPDVKNISPAVSYAARCLGISLT